MNPNGKYLLPERDLAGLSYAAQIDQMTGFESWANSLGVETHQTRIHRYIKYLREIDAGRFDTQANIFQDPPDNPFRHPMDRALYVCREVHELLWIYNGLKDAECWGLPAKLRETVGGTDFATYDKNTTSRDTQFEL